jgi:hypothetical protein
MKWLAAQRRDVLPASGIPELLERIEDFESRATEILVVAGRDCETVPSGRRCEIAVFHRHSLNGSLEEMLLFRPDMRHCDVEPVDASVHRLDKPCKPGLQRCSLSSFLRPYPEDCEGVARHWTPTVRMMALCA